MPEHNGGSSGRPTERGLPADALAALDHAHARHPDVAVMGRGLGGGVAVRAAGDRAVERLVLVTAYERQGDARRPAVTAHQRRA